MFLVYLALPDALAKIYYLPRKDMFPYDILLQTICHTQYDLNVHALKQAF